MSQGTAPPSAARLAKIPVWDVPTRLFHWSLAALIVSAYVTRNYFDDPALYWHRINGYVIIAVLLFRLFWGFCGPATARFASFRPAPRAAWHYALAFARGRKLHYLGHNPLGGLLIWAMLLAVAGQASAGLFTSDDSFAEGPLAESVSSRWGAWFSVIHAKGFKVILVLVGLHIASNLAYQFLFRDPLITAMITGRKPVANYVDGGPSGATGPSRVSAGRAAVCLCLALAITGIGLKLCGASLLR